MATRQAPRSNPVSVPSGDTESLRIRAISNGYLISREGTKRGKWFTHEEYSPTKPQVTAAAPVKKAGSKPKAKR